MVSLKKSHRFRASQRKKLRISSIDPIANETNNRKGVQFSLGKRTRLLVVIVAIVAIVISSFAFLPRSGQGSDIEQSPTDDPTSNTSTNPIATHSQNNTNTNTPTPSPYSSNDPHVDRGGWYGAPGLIESSTYMNSTVWKTIAANSWSYFQPGVGVDSRTGLPYAGAEYPFFTDWDLGAYIQAIIDAQQIGLISSNGVWGSSQRIEKVLTFLENRSLNDAGYPFWFYDAKTTDNDKSQSDLSTTICETADTGKLLVSLSNLKLFNQTLTPRIDYLVYNRSDYKALLSTHIAPLAGDNGIYSYYQSCGYAAFWPANLSAGGVGDVPGKIINNILNSQQFNVSGVQLPAAKISCEPLLSSLFELRGNTYITNFTSQISNLTQKVYLAHEGRYAETKEYVAFSEGNSGGDVFLYEWVVLPNGDTWVVTDPVSKPTTLGPIIYNKVAYSFLALYNSTYAKNVAIYLEKCLPDPGNGYCDGSSFALTVDGKILVRTVGSNTNGLILEAAAYALKC